jgi:biotin carboxylase
MNQYEGKRLLIISGGAEALPIIEFARGLGLSVVVSDGDPDAPGFEIADERIVASTYAIVDTADKAKELSAKCKIDGVMSAAADVPYTVAYVAKELGALPSIGVESGKYAMDKLLMKGLFRDAGVPIGRFSTVNSFDHLERILPEITSDIVIKPTDSRGARGVVRIGRGVTPLRGYEEAVKESPTGTCMIEEWIDGPQISTESVLTPEGISTPGLSLRNYSRSDEFYPYVIEDGGDLPADITEGQRREIDEVIKAAAGALNITRGIIKGDIVMSKNGALVIEIAPRLSGGFFCTHTGPLSSGVDIVKAAIDFALGFDVDYREYKPKFETFVSQRFLFPAPGTVKEVKVAESLKDDPRVAFLNISVKPGDVVSEIKSHPCRAGSVITTGKSKDEAKKAAIEALSGIEIIIGEDG